MDQHEAVAALKELALELGRTPTKVEFCQRVRGGDYFLKQIRGYAVLLKSAGMDTYHNAKIDNSIFETSIQKHIESYSPREVIEQLPYPRVASISDIHFPFKNNRVLDRFYRNLEKKQHDHVVLGGDAWDMFSHGRFPRSHNVFTPKEEEELSRKMNEEFWSEVHKAAPKAKCYQLMGNHDVRPMKKILAVYPEAENWIQKIMQQLFSFDGVKTLFDFREELILNGVMFHHGYLSKLGDHRDYVLQDIVVGHTHRAGIVYRHFRGRTFFEMNNGLAGDPEAKGLTYTPQKSVHWTPAFSEIEEDGPRVIIC